MTAVARDEGPLVAVSRPAGGVALVLLNRPSRRNALTRQFLGLLVDAFTRLRAEASNGEVRAVVVTGAGTAFCAGLDLTEVAEQGPPDVRELDVVTALTSVGVPVIGAVNGPAVTGGLEIALACDFLVAGESARFADTHARVGIVPGWGLTARLPLAVGQGWARQMSATGDYVDAHTAERIGLVNSVVPDSRLLDTALRLAESAATVDPHVLATVRTLYDAAAEEGAGAAGAGERVIWERGEAVGDQQAVASRRLAVLERGRGQLAGGTEDET
ncbi:enoyl-CoA hydratase [Streptomyces sp. NPDC091271]|uniref:enoyl-CoA hydratase n=1 Tax=Streptomyces sp. NPDC091271 TaxID=3365980 RepID=UPI0038224FC0